VSAAHAGWETDDGWRHEFVDAARAATGGFLFGIPLLYTMEVWWTGQRTTPLRNVALLAIVYLVLLVLHRVSGFRHHADVKLGDASRDAVEALALGLVLTAAVLVLLREITTDTPVGVALSKIVYQSIPFGLGVGVARLFLLGGDDDAAEERSAGGGRDGWRGTFADLGATVLGAVFVGTAIAPTDEIPMLESQMDDQWVLALLGASLVISYVVVFVAGFAGEEQRREHEGVLQHPLTETVVCYLLALVAAAAMLWLFHRTDGPAALTLNRTIVLGLPTAIGGAAGRLAV